MKYTLEDLKRAGTLGSGGPLTSAPYSLFISNVMKRLRSRMPEGPITWPLLPIPVEYREEFFEDRNVKRAVLFLRSNGCEWALRSGHGCTMCGHLAKQTRSLTPLSADDLIGQFMGEFERIDFDDVPILNVYNNGSFFNENELPERARIRILKEISRVKALRMLIVESRPEFITEERMEQTKALLPDVRVEVAMGIETMDDLKRMLSVNKGFTTRQYDRAIQVIRKYELHPRAYVLLKPPFFSEREGIEEAIRTTQYAFGAGAATVSLEACTCQEYTLVEYLVDSGLFRLPKLWSILEVAKKTHHLGKLIIGMFQFYPSPKDVPYNCDKCSHDVLAGIRDYNRSLRTESFDGLDCDCRRAWQLELEKDQGTFEQRLERFRKKVNEDKLLAQI